MDVPPLLGGALDGSEFVIAEWLDENESSAQEPVAPLHVHHGDDEAWYVLEGALGFIRGDQHLEARAGSGVLVRRGSAHTFWNAAGTRTRYLIVMTPRIAQLIAALHEPGAFDDLHGVFHRFDSELLV